MRRLGLPPGGLTLLVIVLFASGAVGEPRPAPAGRVSPTLGRAAYEALERAQELVADGRAADAAALLQERVEKGSRYERAVTLQSLGIALVAAERPEPALAAFESALETGALPEQAAGETRLQIGQLQLRTGRIEDGIATLETWLAGTEDPPASAHVLVGNAYAQAGRYSEAVGHVERGIEASGDPPDSWLRLAAELHLALGNAAAALPYLERVVRTSGRKTDWNRLVATHRALGDVDRALATAQLAAELGLRSDQSEQLELVELLLASGRPLAAATALERGLADGTIAPTADLRVRVGRALRLARESERAVEVLGATARETGTPDVWLEVAQLYIEAERFAEAETALRRAIVSTDDALRARASLHLGIVQLELGQLDEAASALETAARHDDTRRSARGWQAALDARRAATTR